MATQTTETRGALARCVEPIDDAEFLADYWEQRPLAVPRAEEGRFDDLLSVADVERLVCSGGLRYPAFRMVKEGGQIRLAEYATDLNWRPDPFTGVADPDRVAAAFEQGATIVLQALHLSWAPVARFCRRLEAELGYPAQANSYYTPRDSQGFAVHHDTHDVFVLQVAGEKHWRIYDPLWELPLKQQRYSKELGEHGRPVLELTLRAGDTLYLPRGWLHDALTSETDSLHITVGVNVHTWIDAVRAALDECEDDVEFRRSVPADGEMQVDLLGRLAERLTPDAVARRRRRRFVDSRRPILDGQLEEVRALSALGVDTMVERRPTAIADLDGTTLSFEGKHVTFPDHVREELEAVATAGEPFCAADLPGDLDDESRLVLLRRLIREGFLRRSPAGA
ncbi:MAG TPA: cupin domain-containing protein [Gaiellaceae bacterium]|nr:cupin domain-containing protein [Gaiellaceae bacterium]